MSIARAVDDWGYDYVWLADKRFFRDVYGSLALCAQNTKRVRLGPCVTDPFSRHPALTAVALTTLNEISGGRARDRKVPVYVDDAGGARVGPAVFHQPKTLEMGVDVAATGLDKYGTMGPRLGALAGEKSLVSRIRARAFECGLEARPLLYPAAVRSLEARSRIPGRASARPRHGRPRRPRVAL